MHLIKTITIINFIFFFSGIILQTSGDNNNNNNSNNNNYYGVDVSFPIHHEKIVNDNYPWRQKFYDEFINGCRESVKDLKDENQPDDICEIAEQERLDMNLGQASAMKNYTKNGFKKIRAPPNVINTLTVFWKHNHDQSEEEEEWYPGETFTNHWLSPTYIIDVKDSIDGVGKRLTEDIIDSIEDVILEQKNDDDDDWFLEDTTMDELTYVTMYGLRVYKNGAVVAPHLDRLPLVISGMICVAKDVDEGEDWPVEVIGHDGRAYNVSLDVGDMLLYEGHSVINGHPFALKGNYFAALYIHFHPANEVYDGIEDEEEEEEENFEEEYEDEEEEEAYAETDDGTEAHIAAIDNDLNLLKLLSTKDASLLTTPDANGWQPIHEAARSGSLRIIEYLIDEGGVDVNEKTVEGATPLYYAVEAWGEGDEVVDFLVGRGGVVLKPVPEL